MWPRICEALLAAWLFFSPGILRIDEPTTAWIARVTAVVMFVASLVALSDRFRRAYLVTLAVALGIVGVPFLSPPPASPMLQNLIITGLLIAMFAVMPPEAFKPPRGWRRT